MSDRLVEIALDPQAEEVRRTRALRHSLELLALPGERPDWDTYFLNIAVATAVRADCSRRKVGAVIVKDNRIMATGYNGSRPGGPSCLAGQCPRGLRSTDEVTPLTSSYDSGIGACIALHAEQNAVMYASREQREDASIYITCEPCPGCLRMLEGSGIARVIFFDPESAYPRVKVLR